MTRMSAQAVPDQLCLFISYSSRDLDQALAAASPIRQCSPSPLCSGSLSVPTLRQRSAGSNSHVERAPVQPALEQRTPRAGSPCPRRVWREVLFLADDVRHASAV